MYKAMTKANKKLQLSRLEQETMLKGDILALGKMMNSMRFSSPERKDDIWNIYNLLCDKTSDKGYNITKDQSDFGIDWLKRIILNKKEQLRNSKQAADFREVDAEIIRDFAKFEFVGFEENCYGYGNSHYTPIYRTIGKDGRYFDYTVGHWGTPAIVGRGKYLTKLEKALK
jgi:hypothetical protein